MCTMRKSDLTGAVTQVDNKAFEKSVSTSIDQVLQGRAAGVQIQANTGTPGGSSTIRIRGTNCAPNSWARVPTGRTRCSRQPL